MFNACHRETSSTTSLSLVCEYPISFDQREANLTIIQGAPFDIGTSYRPGARFGPSGIRQGSRRLNLYGGYNVPLKTNPFNSWATVLDCGDIPVTS